MNPRRLGEVFRQEFTQSVRRPLFWVLMLILGFMALEMSKGNAQIGSGNTAVGGSKAWITSEFAMAQLMALMLSVVYAFFIAVAAGMSVIRDEDLKVGEVLHATPLTPAEYVWGKFLAVVASFVGVLVLQLALIVLFNHGMPHGENVEVIGPFVAANYLRATLLFALPVLIAIAGTSFAIGTMTRMPILVFALPIAYILAGMTILWDWSPAWLNPEINRLLIVLDPAGIRWLNETWLKVDRGVDFYNKAHVGLDANFWLNRIAIVAIGLGAVFAAERRFATTLRGAHTPKRTRGVAAAPDAIEAPGEPGRLAALAMRSGAPGFLAGMREVARVELRELRSHPGLYLFVPLILVQTIGSVVGVGAFDAPLLFTPGTLAVNSMNTLTLLICMLLLFYTVESVQRERGTGFGAIYYSTPLRTGALLLGKAIANAVVASIVLLAALIGNAIVLAVQGKVPFRLEPFLLAWGLLLVPTFLVWTSFAMAVFTVTASRYATYAIGLGAMVLTGFLQMRDKMNWAFNWDLWSATGWSDISVFEFDRLPLMLNRIEVLGLTVFFIAVTARLFPRTEGDATRLVHRMRPAALAGAALRALPLLVVPLIAGGALWLQVQQGFEGAHARKLAKDYWKRNVETWAYAPLPALAKVDLDVAFEPARRRFQVNGTYDLVNTHAEALRQVPLTGGFSWDSVAWTMNGAAYRPEDRAKLYVFTPEHPLQSGEHLRIGFRYGGTSPGGISKNGHGRMEFIVPSAVVYTGFSGPTLVPQIGYVKEIGPKSEDRQEPRQFPDDEWRNVLPAMAPMAERSCDTRIRVTVPADFRANASGVLESESVQGGKRTMVWVSDRPLKIFNIVAGRWAVKQGDGVTVYYHPSHTYNLNEMMDALSGARRWYSEWFAPYPWRELRLSEFPAIARYAQGPATNITFSESIGFLTKSEPKANAAFWITAHESAHQWWGNILTPSERPGGEVLSEGMAHFSTIMLTEQVKGLEQRLAFCREIETRYGRTRRADAERPLTRIDGSRPGDSNIIYDKGGYAAWMMMHLIGREPMLTGLREFIAMYRENPDHPVLQDYLAVMRRHAPDTTAFDAFTKQWYYEVVVPEYRLSDARAVKHGNEWEVRAKIRNAGTGTMPVEVAAVRGERFANSKQSKTPYQDARATVLLGPKQSSEVTIRCAFEPERVLADPDLMVLQLQRAKATAKVDIEKSEVHASLVR